jgi:Ser-tRNA(Ala) deacylase AlaX
MNITQLDHHLQEAREELESLKKGKKASAARCRSHLQKLKKECDVLRKDILEYTKGLPVKKKEKKIDMIIPVITPEEINTIVENSQKSEKVDNNIPQITPIEMNKIVENLQKLDIQNVESTPKKVRKPRVKKSIKKEL